MIEEKEYKKRRKQLLKALSKDSIALLFANEFKSRSNDTEFPFRQNSNFYYLSGLKEDNSCLMFIKTAKREKTILFVEKKDPQKELWSGKRLGVKAAKKCFDIDEVYEITELSSKIKEYIKDKKTLYYDFKLDYSKVKVLKRYSKEMGTFKNIALVVQKMRLIKSPAEVALIKKAISITKIAHHRAMKEAQNLQYEYQLQSEIEYVFKKNGAYSDAYTSIVASGDAANTLHYIANDQELQRDKLILIDAGCEYEYYASDITRTIPVTGKFTSVQKDLYNMVLNVELEIIEMVKEGVLRSKLQKRAVKLLTEGMCALGILQTDVKTAIKKELYKNYYPHGIGHWMGLDVHDEAPYKDTKGKEIALKAGMVLTIEPGIYLPLNDKKIPKKYRGIGIRIEDDILVTKEGYENLSAGIAKSVEEIESLS